jgi:crossover junction endodeoxyribonuclease RuvC
MIFGIDPGYTGAIAALPSSGQLLAVIDMPLIKGHGYVKDEIDELAIIRFLKDHGMFSRLPHVFIEKVHSMPGQGVSSTFRFGVSYGIVRAAAAGLELPVHLISPQAWHAAVGLPKSPDKVSGKALARQKAAQLFPSFASQFSRVRDGGRAEAALLALAGQKLLAPPPQTL